MSPWWAFRSWDTRSCHAWSWNESLWLGKVDRVPREWFWNGRQSTCFIRPWATCVMNLKLDWDTSHWLIANKNSIASLRYLVSFILIWWGNFRGRKAHSNSDSLLQKTTILVITCICYTMTSWQRNVFHVTDSLQRVSDVENVSLSCKVAGVFPVEKGRWCSTLMFLSSLA